MSLSICECQLGVLIALLMVQCGLDPRSVELKSSTIVLTQLPLTQSTLVRLKLNQSSSCSFPWYLPYKNENVVRDRRKMGNSKDTATPQHPPR